MAASMEKTRHPGIYKRGSRYVVVWRHRGKQHKSFHRTLAEAREAKGERQAGDRAPATRASFEDYAREWLDTYQGRTSRGLSETTRSDYRRSIEQHAVPFFHGYRLAEIERPDVRRFVQHLEASGLAPSSAVKNLAPLKALFATARDDDALRSNPAEGARVNRSRGAEVEEPEAKALTRVELESLLAELPEDRRLIFELLAHTGLRISEAIGLDWPDLEFGNRPRLRVRRQCYRGTVKRLKSSNGRRDLPLSAGLARRLWAARPARAEGPMFPTLTGERQADRDLRRVLDPATVSAGVPWASFHSLRHTCASLLFESGKNVKQVADWLGHADPAFTLRVYVHLLDGGLGGADFLDEAVKVGNRWATQGPETAANEGPAEVTESAG